jgi:hypothetical protein
MPSDGEWTSAGCPSVEHTDDVGCLDGILLTLVASHTLRVGRPGVRAEAQKNGGFN